MTTAIIPAAGDSCPACMGLTKIGARDRVQLVIAAYEAGLVSPNTPGFRREP